MLLPLPPGTIAVRQVDAQARVLGFMAGIGHGMMVLGRVYGMAFFDPFSYRLAESARRRVEGLRRIHPEADNQELARRIITDKARLCGVVGAITALPAVFPGLGTLIAVISGVAVDIMVFSVVLYRLVLELSVVYGRNPFSVEVQKEAVRVFGLAAGVDVFGKKAARFTAYHLSRQATATGMNRPLIYLGLRASQRSLLGRVIPFLGVFVAGGISFLFARSVGYRILKHYDGEDRRGRVGPWKGRTISTDYRVT